MNGKKILSQPIMPRHTIPSNCFGSQVGEEQILYFINHPNNLIRRYFQLAVHFVDRSSTMYRLRRKGEIETAIERCDFIQEALIALWEAIKTFEPLKGGYPTHAWWTIRARLQKLEPRIETIYIPKTVYEYILRNFYFRTYFDATSALRQLKNDQPVTCQLSYDILQDALFVFKAFYVRLDDDALDEFAEDTAQSKKQEIFFTEEIIIDEDQIWKGINLLSNLFDIEVNDERESLLEDAHNTCGISEDRLQNLIFINRILNDPSILTERERLVLYLRYGPDEKTYEEIGKVVASTKLRKDKCKKEPLAKQAVIYIEKKALRKIRSFLKK